MIDKVVYSIFVIMFIIGILAWFVFPPISLWLTGLLWCRVVAIVWVVSYIIIALFIVGISRSK